MIFFAALPAQIQSISWTDLSRMRTLEWIVWLANAAAWGATAWAAGSLLTRPSTSTVRLLRYASLGLTLTWLCGAILVVRLTLEDEREIFLYFSSIGAALLSEGLPRVLLLAIAWHPASAAMLGRRGQLTEASDHNASDHNASDRPASYPEEPWAQEAICHIVRVLASLAITLAAPALLDLFRTLFVMQRRLSWTRPSEFAIRLAPTLSDMANDVSSVLLAAGGLLLLVHRRAGRRALIAGAALRAAYVLALLIVSPTYMALWSPYRRNWMGILSSVTAGLQVPVICALFFGILTRKIVRDYIHTSFHDLTVPPAHT
jgi:hypothetical protein